MSGVTLICELTSTTGASSRVLTMASTVAHLFRLTRLLSAAGPAISPHDPLVHWWIQHFGSPLYRTQWNIDKLIAREERQRFCGFAQLLYIYTSLFTVTGSKNIKNHTQKHKKTQTIYKMSNQTSRTLRLSLFKNCHESICIKIWSKKTCAGFSNVFQKY